MPLDTLPLSSFSAIKKDNKNMFSFFINKYHRFPSTDLIRTWLHQGTCTHNYYKFIKHNSINQIFIKF